MTFKQLFVGETSDRGKMARVIKNVGKGRLRGKVTIDACSAFFVEKGADYDLGAGETDTVLVRFLPWKEGEHICMIDFGELCGHAAVEGRAIKQDSIEFSSQDPSSWSGATNYWISPWIYVHDKGSIIYHEIYYNAMYIYADIDCRVVDNGSSNNSVLEFWFLSRSNHEGFGYGMRIDAHENTLSCIKAKYSETILISRKIEMPLDNREILCGFTRDLSGRIFIYYQDPDTGYWKEIEGPYDWEFTEAYYMLIFCNSYLSEVYTVRVYSGGI